MGKTKVSEVEESNREFYAAWDNISTTIPWKRPQKYNLIKWRDILFDMYGGIDGYNVYLVGGFAEYLYNKRNLMTWDADIIFIPTKPIDFTYMKSMLDDSLKIALDNRLLIDQKVVTKHTHQLFTQLHTGVIPIHEDDGLMFWKNYKKFTKIVDGEVEVDMMSEKCTEVTTGLYETIGLGNGLKEKVIDKYKRGIYTGRIVNLKTTDFNFKK